MEIQPDETTENPAVEEESPAEGNVEASAEDSVEAPDPEAGETAGLKITTPDGEVRSIDDLKKLGGETVGQLATAVIAPGTKAIGDWFQIGVETLKGAVAGALGERKKDDE
jgi:hypothetical protein|tara:strand:+ start:255 stop:587 length:333 start_codon:yes stop_codon:yes gene_type:complete